MSRGGKPSPQAMECLAVLEEQGPAGLTQLEALRTVGTLRLAARIEELRLAGYQIETRTEKVASGKHVGRYFLKGRVEPAPPPIPDAPKPPTLPLQGNRAGPPPEYICPICGLGLTNVEPSSVDPAFVVGKCGRHKKVWAKA